MANNRNIQRRKAHKLIHYVIADDIKFSKTLQETSVRNMEMLSRLAK